MFVKTLHFVSIVYVLQLSLLGPHAHPLRYYYDHAKGTIKESIILRRVHINRTITSTLVLLRLHNSQRRLTHF